MKEDDVRKYKAILKKRLDKVSDKWDNDSEALLALSAAITALCELDTKEQQNSRVKEIMESGL